MADSGESPLLWFLDTLVAVRVAHAAGSDGISLLEHRAPARHSPPLHVHTAEDELFHVLDGAFRFQVDGDQLWLEAGSFLLVPKGTPHTFRVESAGGRWFTVTTHSDFERFVRAVGLPAPRAELPPPPGPPAAEEMERLVEVARRHNIEIVGPPLHD